MPFLDAMLHLPILQTESLLLPTRVQAVAIDPELHEKHVHTFEDETQGLFKFEPRHEKPEFCLCDNKGADQLCSECTADQRLCFATHIVRVIPFFLKARSDHNVSANV